MPDILVAIDFNAVIGPPSIQIYNAAVVGGAPDHGGDRVDRRDQFLLLAAQLALERLGLRNVAIGRQNGDGLPPLVARHCPTARNHHHRTAFAGSQEFTLPMPGLDRACQQVGDRRRRGGAREFVDIPSDRLLLGPPVQAFGTEAPEADTTIQATHDNGIVGEVQEIDLLLQRHPTALVPERERGHGHDRQHAHDAARHGAECGLIALGEQKSEHGQRHAHPDDRDRDGLRRN